MKKWKLPPLENVMDGVHRTMSVMDVAPVWRAISLPFTNKTSVGRVVWQ